MPVPLKLGPRHVQGLEVPEGSGNQINQPAVHANHR